MKTLAPTPSALRLEIGVRSIALILATGSLVWLLYELRVVVLLLLIALIIAGTVNPLITWMETRGFRRVYALILFFLALSGVAGVLFLLTIPSLVDQLTQLVQNAPATRERLIATLASRSATAPLAKIVESSGLQSLFSSIGTYLLSYSSAAMLVVGYSATAFVLSFYLLADNVRTLRLAYAIVPVAYHQRLSRILPRLETIVGAYMRGQFITSAAIGVFTFLLLVICRVPNARSLALVAGLVDVIPFIGGLLVIIPAALSALTRGLPIAAVVVVALAVYMEIESRVLVPRVYGRALRLPSTAVILALVAGGVLMGILGALLALPIAAGLFMILQELRVETPGDELADASLRIRHAP